MITLLLALAPATTTPAALDHPTSEVGKAFIEQLMVDRNYEAAADLAHPDLLFRDPTASLVAPLLVEGVRGRDEVVAKMKSFGVGSVRMEPHFEFDAGEYHCFFGTFETRPAGAPKATRFPFMTVLRVEDGLVTERMDYGDYDPYLPASHRVDGVEDGFDHPMVVAAQEYVRAYGARDFEAMEALWAEGVVFQDRTAAVFGTGGAHQGREQLLPLLERALGGLPSFAIETESVFFHADTAVFAGMVHYAMPGRSLGLEQETFEVSHPLILVLRLQDGKVARHDDFADYASFFQALKQAKAASGATATD